MQIFTKNFITSLESRLKKSSLLGCFTNSLYYAIVVIKKTICLLIFSIYIYSCLKLVRKLFVSASVDNATPSVACSPGRECSHPRDPASSAPSG